VKSISGKIVNHDCVINGTVEFSQRIESVSKDDNLKTKNIILPGFVDLHCHGGKGFDTMAGLSSIKKMSEYHLACGTTSLLPTTLTATLDNTIQALQGLNSFIGQNKNLTNILGAHLEGPFINPNKLGAQPPHTQLPNINFIKKIQNIAKIRVITLAPELEGAATLIDYLINNNINVQIGHSLADYNCCKKLMDKNNIGFTHLFNAMTGCNHRHPGIATAALNHAEFSEIICDLLHVDPANIHLAHKSIPCLYAITDAISACGMPDGTYDFANEKIEKKHGQAIINNNILAGSVVTMLDTFKNLIKINFSLQQAVAMTSYHAAQYLKENDKGKIERGFCANLLVLNQQYNIKEVYLYGDLVTSI
tara:strand:- start:78 stop:1169 length:1092 start_codon:yes stop_codon:yes gene_type:complete